MASTQLTNIEKKTGRTRVELVALVRALDGRKHMEMVAHLKAELGLGHGDANLLVHEAKAGGEPTSGPDEYYTGDKAALRPIHERVMAAVAAFGEFEIAPKKTYSSLRRKKQFAMVGPATKTRVEVGLNMKGVPATARLEALPAGGMCQYRVKVTRVEEVDAELVAWIKMAFDAAG